MDDAIGRDLPDAVVAAVGDEDDAAVIHRQAAGRTQERGGSGALIAGEARGARAGHGSDRAAGVYFPDTIAVGVGDKNIAGGVDSASAGLVELCQAGLAAIARIARRAVARGGLDYGTYGRAQHPVIGSVDNVQGAGAIGTDGSRTA